MLLGRKSIPRWSAARAMERCVRMVWYCMSVVIVSVSLIGDD